MDVLLATCVDVAADSAAVSVEGPPGTVSTAGRCLCTGGRRTLSVTLPALPGSHLRCVCCGGRARDTSSAMLAMAKTTSRRFACRGCFGSECNRFVHSSRRRGLALSEPGDQPHAAQQDSRETGGARRATCDYRALWAESSVPYRLDLQRRQHRQLAGHLGARFGTSQKRGADRLLSWPQYLVLRCGCLAGTSDPLLARICGVFEPGC